MNYKLFFLFFIITLSSCSVKNQVTYLNDFSKSDWPTRFENFTGHNIQVGDVLDIKVMSIIPEAAIPYNSIQNNMQANTIELMKLNGYVVDDSLKINFPVLGEISVNGFSTNDLEKYLMNQLIMKNHLVNPSVSVNILNLKFTILGEVNTPGTFSHFEKKINIFQAIGYANDLTINAKRNEVTIIREKNGHTSFNKIDLRKASLLKSKFYYIENNDVIIVNPNYSKVKSAGFIGNATSITSISTLFLSIALLILNSFPNG